MQEEGGGGQASESQASTGPAGPAGQGGQWSGGDCSLAPGSRGALLFTVFPVIQREEAFQRIQREAERQQQQREELQLQEEQERLQRKKVPNIPNVYFLTFFLIESFFMHFTTFYTVPNLVFCFILVCILPLFCVI